MREILFKAKRIDNGEWVEGLLILLTKFSLIEEEEPEIVLAIQNLRVGSIEVDPETICQYTGLTDKNGKKIWENDFLKYEYDGRTTIDVIKFEPPMFTYSKSVRWSLWKDEVIGNIFDNPELVEGGAE